MDTTQNSISTSGGSLYGSIQDTSDHMKPNRTRTFLDIKQKDGSVRKIQAVAQTDPQSGFITHSGFFKMANSDDHMSFAIPLPGQGGAQLIQQVSPSSSQDLVAGYANVGIFGALASIASAVIPLVAGALDKDGHPIPDLLGQSDHNTYTMDLSVGPGILTTSYPTVKLGSMQAVAGSTNPVAPVIDDTIFGNVLAKGFQFAGKNYADQLNSNCEKMAIFLNANFSEHLSRIAHHGPENCEDLVAEVSEALEAHESFGGFLDTLSTVVSAVSTAAPAVLTVAKAVGSVF